MIRTHRLRARLSRQRLGVLLGLSIIAVLAACSAGGSQPPQRTYAYAVGPDLPIQTNHFVKQCRRAVPVVHTGDTFPLVWHADLVTINTTPVVASAPQELQISIALVGPYKACGSSYRGIVSLVDGHIWGPLATALPTITTDDWHHTTFPQRLPIPKQTGFYVFYEHLFERRRDGSPFNSVYVEWIQVISPHNTHAPAMLQGGKS